MSDTKPSPYTHIEFEVDEPLVESHDSPVFEEEPEIPTKRFHSHIEALLREADPASEHEPTRNDNYFELFRNALRDRDFGEVDGVIQTLNFLLLGSLMDGSDLAFNVQQLQHWLTTGDADERLFIGLSDNSFMIIQFIGGKEGNGEPTFSFTNEELQQKFVKLEHGTSAV